MHINKILMQRYGTPEVQTGNGVSSLSTEAQAYCNHDVQTIGSVFAGIVRQSQDAWDKYHEQWIENLRRAAGKHALNAIYGVSPFEIRDVILNPPATIVFWADGTKTVVKAINEEFDPEKGLAMAIARKALGNKGSYFNHIKKWTEPYCAEILGKMEGCNK